MTSYRNRSVCSSRISVNPAARRRLLLLCTVMAMALGVFAPAALALGPDDGDPVLAFDHLQNQRDQAAQSIATSGASVSTTSAGGFILATPADGDAPRPGGVFEQMPQVVSRSYNPLTGALAFSWGSLGQVTFTPTERDAPDQIFHSGTTVSATGIANDLSEVTIASTAQVEQHLVVDEQHASNKLIEYAYSVTASPGIEIVAAANGLSIMRASSLLMSVKADVAVDEKGTHYPVTSSFDAVSQVLTVHYDGRGNDPIGDVAIDPVYMGSDEPYAFVMNVCRQPPGAECAIRPGTGLPPRFLSSADTGMHVGADAAFGLFTGIGAKDTSIAAGASTAAIYPAFPGTEIYWAFAHSNLIDASGAFGCEVELLDAGASGYSLVGSNNWVRNPTVGDATPIPFKKETVKLYRADEKSGAQYAALRMTNLSGSAYVSPGLNTSRCSMRLDNDEHVGGEEGDLFTVYMRDLKDPVIDPPVDFTPPVDDLISLVPVSYKEEDGQLNINVQATRAKMVDPNGPTWYRDGQEVWFSAHATDEGSGVKVIRVFNVHPPASPPQPNAIARIDFCNPISNNSEEPPCRLETTIETAHGTIGPGMSAANGLNTLWYQVEDFSGRTATVAAHYLRDHIAPSTPTPAFGSTNSDIAQMPVRDAIDDVQLSWAASIDPGANTPDDVLPTGSGVAEYSVTVDKYDTVGHAWAPFGTAPTVTVKVAGVAADWTPSLKIDAREGIFRATVTAIDRAGNASAPSAYRYFRVDTHAPLIGLTSPPAGTGVDVRSDRKLAAEFWLLDPVVGGGEDQAVSASVTAPKPNAEDDATSGTGNRDIVDEVKLQRSPKGLHDAWTDIESTLAQHQLSGTPFAPSTIGNDIPDGYWDIRAIARDGRINATQFVHTRLSDDGDTIESPSGRFSACVDTAIHARNLNEIPTNVKVLRLIDAHNAARGAIGYRINFEVPITSMLATRWIIERYDPATDGWLVVGIRTQQGRGVGAVTSYDVTDAWPNDSAGVRWRVSGATQDCTRTGDTAIATEGDVVGEVAGGIDMSPLPLLGLERYWSYWSMPTGAG
ncbi:MAG: secreted agglutinin, partial [Thermoleophilia bacterium]|nr:secreted agglutinin [Thermoleophilia bacterium]